MRRSTVTPVGTSCFTSLHLLVSTLFRFFLASFPFVVLGDVSVLVALNDAAIVVLLKRGILLRKLLHTLSTRGLIRVFRMHARGIVLGYLYVDMIC
jgi:hypothetical protein